MATPNMGLVLPVVTVTPGPTYASENNAAFTTVDAHNHTPGLGVPIPTAGIALNADLPFNSFNAITLRSVQVNNNSVPLALPADVTCLYGSGGNLYWNNAIGQQVQITSGAGLNASSIGAIGGDYGTSTASLFYTSAASTFTFWQNANQSALIDCGTVTIRPVNTTGRPGVTIAAPVSLAGNFSLTLPGALPASTKIVTIDSSGNIASNYDVDNFGIIVSSNTLQLGPQGVLGSNIALNTIDGTMIVPNVSLPGNVVGVGGNQVLTQSAGAPAMFTHGRVASNGIPQTGFGFTCVRNSVGNYTITFSPSFSSIPTVVATVDENTNGTQGIYAHPTTGGSCTIICVNSSTAALNDFPFNFMAIGAR